MTHNDVQSLTRISRRRLLGASAAVSAGALGLAGCDGAGGGSGSADLRIWSWASEFEDALAGVIKQYQQANPGVTVTQRYWDFGSYGSALQAALTAGDEADIFMPLLATHQLGKAERVLDLKEALGEDFLSRFFESTNAENVYGDGQWAVGWAAQTFGLFYNKDLLKKAKVEPPETWDDLIDIAPVIKDRTGTVPMAIQGNPSNRLADFFLPIITQITDDPQLVLDLDTHEKADLSWTADPVVEGLTKIKELTAAGVFSDGVLATDSDTSNSTFVNGQAAMLYNGSFMPPVLQTEAPEEFREKYAIAKTPAWKPGAKHWTANQAGYTWAISAKSKNQDQAIDFLSYLYEPDRYATLMNDTYSMPATTAAAETVASPDIKEMTSWLVDGEGAPHIMFGTGTMDAVSNGVVAVINGSKSPAEAAKQIEDEVQRARKLQ